MKNAFIIHGAYGNPQENWVPWLKRELEAIGYDVIVPQFPTPEGQTLESWLRIFEQYTEQINEETIMIGHSVGATFILSILEGLPYPIHHVYLVSGFISDLQNTQFDSINRSFYQKVFNWEKITHNSFSLFHGDNDPYVPLSKAYELAEKIKSSVTVVHRGGRVFNF